MTEDEDMTPIVCTRCRLRMVGSPDNRCACGAAYDAQQVAASNRRVSATCLRSADELTESLERLERRLAAQQAVHASRAALETSTILIEGREIAERLRSPRVGDERVEDMKAAMDWRRRAGEFLSARSTEQPPSRKD